MEDKKKVFFLDHAPYESGAEKVLQRLLRSMPQDAYEYHVIAHGKASWIGAMPKYVKVHPFTFHWKAYKLYVFLFLDLLKLFSILVKEKPDIIHANTRVSMILVGMLKSMLQVTSKLPNTKFVAHVHDLDPLPQSKWFLIRQFDELIAISNNVNEFLLEGGVDGEKITIIPNGLDVDSYYTSPAERNTVLFIGQLYPRKGVDVLIKAFAKMDEGVELKIIGQDQSEGKKYQKEYESLVNELHVTERVSFLGFIPTEDVMKELSTCTVLCVPSREEPFGLVAIEAMAAGKPVIASRVGGLSEIVVDGETGVLVDPGNINQLSEALSKLLSDSELRQAMGENGRKRVEDRFSIEVQVERVVNLYRDNG